MSAANIVSKNKEIDETNLIKISDKLSLLKSKAIYGANASGKSNLIRGLVSFIAIVSDSVRDDKILEERIDPFQLSTETVNNPSYFQLSFLLKGVYYRYGFEATVEEIKSEWLIGSPGKKEVPFFTREVSEIKINERQFKEGSKLLDLFKSGNNDVARNNSLFLTTIKSFYNVGIAKEIAEFIKNIIVISGLNDNTLYKNAERYLENNARKEKITDFLKIADTGIISLDKFVLEEHDEREIIKQSYVFTGHQTYNAASEATTTTILSLLNDESEGTRKIFELSPLIIESLEEKRTLVIDEFDARLHPLLTKKLVQLFNSESNKGTQFVFATHDTNLLDAQLLRRDQICFAEKDKYGASHFYTLVDFKGIRNDASFEKDYIAGRYGAIPFIGDFSTLIGE
ncbi:MAG: ATP-binding protein [Bacteroidota bacterium]